jgi:predicted NAD/FAD-dependent oxidoreductase
MLAAGIIRKWQGSAGEEVIGYLSSGGTFTPRAEGSATAYVGVAGMGSIPKFLAQQQKVEQPVWVSTAQQVGNRWRLWHYKEQLGDFDYIVIAHNGKCAARLMSTAGAAVAPITQALTTKFAAVVRNSPPRNMHLCSLWVLMAQYEPHSALTELYWEGAFIRDSPDLSWVCDNTAKLQQQQASSSGGARSWVLVSSRAFGSAHKCPQEAVPAAKAAEVTALLNAAFEQSLGLPAGSLKLSNSVVQLWGAANPISVADIAAAAETFIFAGDSRVGVCGDWLSGASLAAAAQSGSALATHIAQHIAAAAASLAAAAAPQQQQQQQAEQQSAFKATSWDRNLPTRFRLLPSEAVGEFPGCSSSAAAPPLQQEVLPPRAQHSGSNSSGRSSGEVAEVEGVAVEAGAAGR